MRTHTSVLLSPPDFSKRIFPTLNGRKWPFLVSLYVDLYGWYLCLQDSQTQEKKKKKRFVPESK